MGVKLMTGATGEQNIQAADDRECLAGITGLDSYVFPTGSQLKATLVDANTVTIGTGAGSLQGSRFRCSTTTTVNIQSGTQGQFRHDVIGLHFSRETSGREGLEFQVLTGEPAASEGAAADPAYTAGDLLKGDAEAFMPLYRIKLNGINAADPEPIFSVLTTLADSVSQPGAWIQHKRITGRTSANSNMTFDGLEYGKFVVLCAIPVNDLVAIPYYQSPAIKLLGAHIIKDTNTYATVPNTNVTVDVWYYEIPSV